MLSAAIRALSALVRRRRPLGPSITSSRETPTPLEPSKWTPILPSLSKSNPSAAHVRGECWLQVKNGRRGAASRLPLSSRPANIAAFTEAATYAWRSDRTQISSCLPFCIAVQLSGISDRVGDLAWTHHWRMLPSAAQQAFNHRTTQSLSAIFQSETGIPKSLRKRSTARAISASSGFAVGIW